MDSLVIAAEKEKAAVRRSMNDIKNSLIKQNFVYTVLNAGSLFIQPHVSEISLLKRKGVLYDGDVDLDAEI